MKVPVQTDEPQATQPSVLPAYEERAPRGFQFGPFEADPDAGELRKLGLKVRLQQQPYQVLLKLLERSGEVVTREELQKYLWGEETFVDFDHGINRLINRIREALGDSAEHPRFVETLPGKGYRFIGQVRPVGPIDAPITAIPIQPLEAIRSTRRSKHSMVPLLLAGLAAAVVVYAAFSSLPSAQPKILRASRMTGDGSMKTISSPLFYASRPLVTDGSRVYFMESTRAGRSLAQVSAAGGETSRLEASFRLPAEADISPDGANLLVVESVLGSEFEAPVKILTLADASLRRVGGLRGHDATWSPGGGITYATGHSLYTAPADGSQSRKLVDLPGLAWWPRWSPDGKKLRFTLIDPSSDSTSLWEVAADGSGLRPLLDGWNNPPSECCGSWTPDGKYYVFQSTRDGQTNIWAIKGTMAFGPFKSSPVQLTVGPMDTLAPLPSRDGKKLFVVGVMPHGELSRFDAPSGHFLPFLSGISAEGLDFSRDGKWITYVAFPDGALWRSKADGTERVQLTVPPLRAFLPRWSPDGKRIAFAGAVPGKPWSIMVVPAEGGKAEQVTTGDCNEGDVGWSADGNQLVFGCLGGTSTAGIRILDLSTRKISPVPGSEGLFAPRWSPDGRYLAAIPEDSDKLVLYDFSTRKWSDLAHASVGYPSWSHDSRAVYFDTVLDDDPGFYRVRLSDRKLERVAGLRDFRRAWGAFEPWSGLAPGDSPLILRDVGTQEVYSLDWQAP